MSKQPAVNVEGITLSFKPNLNLAASSFVPSIKPQVEFSPIKVDLPVPKKDLSNGSVAKQLFAPSTFNVNAPVFKPTIPLPAFTPTPAEPKKRGNKKKKNADPEAKN